MTALVVAACSAPAAPPAPAPPSSTAPPGTTTAAESPFCTDLRALQAGVLVYRADVLKAARSEQQLDVDGMRRRAGAIASLGQSVLAHAPQAISEQIHHVLDAIATSADRMAKRGARVRDVYDPLFTDAARPAFDTVDHYDCTATGG
ncbi:hypothetical protein [Amycolatopsis sp. CA-230715]|uniref:hypothetical protein n=1 Tax=Amycolatopsis sp. CA-230715 TaxID=2745196 RepID=UPI001C0098DC|nr:hypothetical protein [Amycolatopsis sp. CA-230715]QWF82492.1 hypothetical protein HUW46_05929 [Amycolatopsis sp. CA-230715]